MASSKIGRFTIIRELGRGGMGVAYLAYDEQLDRKIAIKLVTPQVEANDEVMARPRLLREAQAMARLCHPNVATVYEAGTYRSQVYMAMEFVYGQSLKSWLQAKPRPWRDVLAIFCQAGRGLQAAHAAGLVHRDFKPSNVMVARDGRVLVLDFGLACYAGEPASESDDELFSSSATSSELLENPLTATGLILGTPGYIAPERLLSDINDALSDQFAFCVSLYEGLYGKRPFGGQTSDEMNREILAGRIEEPPRDSRVPGWLRAVVLRGIRANPAERWPSLDALLAALKRDPAVRRRRWVSTAIATACLVGVGALAQAWVGGDENNFLVCSGAQKQLVDVWDSERRDAVKQAFGGTGVPYAAVSFTAVARLLDRYTDAWTTAYTDACEATAVRKEQSAEVLDLRMGCLAQRRRSLDALVDVLSSVDASMMLKVVDAAGELPSVALCADPSYVSTQIEPPSDAGLEVRIKGLQNQLARARELKELGKYQEGLSLVRTVKHAAQDLDYKPLTAEIALRMGALQEVIGAYYQAEDNLKQAYFAAREVGNRAIAMQAANQLALVVGIHLDRYQEGYTWGQQAQVELGTEGADDEQANVLRSLGILLQEHDDYTGAMTHFRRAKELLEKTRGRESLAIVNIENSIASLNLRQGHLAAAIGGFYRALAIAETIVGPEHPRVIGILNNLGISLRFRGNYKEAERILRQSLARHERLFGVGHPKKAAIIGNLGRTLQDQGRHQEAEQLFRDALAIRKLVYKTDHPDIAKSLRDLGNVFFAYGRYEVAEDFYHQSRSVYENTWGAAHPAIAAPLTGLARIYLHRNQPIEATEYATRAELLTRNNPSLVVRRIAARARFVLARALIAANGDRAHAFALAHQARAIYATLTVEQDSLAEIDEWLRQQEAL